MAPLGPDPPWSGWIETTGDALLILEAARRGLIPRVTRRLVDTERRMIASGSVFVFNEDESGIKRWTDGLFWSPSRILGNFLLYRETDKKGAGHGRRKKGVAGDKDDEGGGVGGGGGESLSRPRSEMKHTIDFNPERTLVGSLTNSYKFKVDGLMKKTFSLTIAGVAQHLISYYKVSDVESGRLRAPSSLSELASLEISPTLLDRGNFCYLPKTDVSIYGVPRYRGDADDVLAAGLDLGLGVGVGVGVGHGHGRRLGPAPVRGGSSQLGNGSGMRTSRNSAWNGEDGEDGEEDTDADADADADVDGDGDATANNYNYKEQGEEQEQDQGPGRDVKTWERERESVEDVKGKVMGKGKNVGWGDVVGFSTLAAAAGQSRLGSKSASTSPIDSAPPLLNTRGESPHMQTRILASASCTLTSAQSALASTIPRTSTSPALHRAQASTLPTLAKASFTPVLTTVPLPPLPATYASTSHLPNTHANSLAGTKRHRSTQARDGPPVKVKRARSATTSPQAQARIPAPASMQRHRQPHPHLHSPQGYMAPPRSMPLGAQHPSLAGTRVASTPTVIPAQAPPQFTHPQPLSPQQQQAPAGPVHLHPLSSYPPASSSSSSLAAAMVAYSQQFAQGAGKKQQQQQTATGGVGVSVSRQGSVGGVSQQEGGVQAVNGGQTQAGQRVAGQLMGPLQPGQALYHPYTYPWYYVSLSSAWHPYAAPVSGQEAQTGLLLHHG